MTQRQAHAKPLGLLVGDQLGDGGLAIQHRDHVSSADIMQVPAEVGFEVGDADAFHGHMIVINGHVAKDAGGVG
jgi:hypothetical protein